VRTIQSSGQSWSLFAESELEPAKRTLLDHAKEAAGHASPRFSDFGVGAALSISGTKDVFHGWNVEDQSLARVLHAEQAALFAAENKRKSLVKVLRIAIWGKGNVPPCGMCRQMIVDSNPKAELIFPYDGGILVATAENLLPLQFSLM
jgi:cytidine deaminase